MVWYGVNIGRLFKDTLDSRGTTYYSIQYSRCPPPYHFIWTLPISYSIYYIYKKATPNYFSVDRLKNIKLRPHQINLLFYGFEKTKLRLNQ